MSLPVLCLAIGFLFSACAPKDRAASSVEPPFHPLDLAAASTKAQGEGKVVFVDLWAPWCGPCKLMETTTWKDPAVIDLLSNHAIAIKVNVDDQVAVAEKYKVQSIPTLLVLRPDGTEVTRVVGYVDGAGFQKEFRQHLQVTN